MSVYNKACLPLISALNPDFDSDSGLDVHLDTSSSTSSSECPGIMASTRKPTFEEWLACTELDFEWAESYDSKDWTRLLAILAPTLTIDYARVNNVFDNLSASAFITMMSNPMFLGDPLIDSQHLFGAAAKWVKESDTEITCCHQSRAAHVRWTDETRGSVAAKGHGHGNVTIKYRKMEGVWKWAGIKTHVRWNEHEWESIFRGLNGKGHQKT